MIFEDFEDKINEEPSESVTITDDDFQSTDSWLMKKHDEKSIFDICNGDTYVEQDLSLIHNYDGKAGSINAKRELKTGEDAPRGVHEIVNLLKFWQYLKKISENSTFVIVSVKEKLFIVTFRLGFKGSFRFQNLHLRLI